MKNFEIKLLIKNLVVIIIGSSLYATSLSFFLEPYNIAPGGFTGISVIINFMTGLPSGTLLSVMNVPLYFIAFKKLGKFFAITTIFTVTIASVLIDMLARFYEDNPIILEPFLATVFGGILLGLGLGLVFSVGSSTGGTDIITKVIQVSKPHLSLGQIMMFIDIFVVVWSAFVFGSIENALYATIAIYISTRVIDMVIEGPDNAKMVYIISDYNEIIAKKIVSDINRGATLLEGHGAYTSARKNVIICAMRIKEIPAIKKIVIDIDPNAFLIVSDVREVLGHGFKVGGKRNV